MFPDNRIRELRKRARLTQHQLGQAVGLHQTQIGNIENGARALTLEWSRRIAKALDVTVADLLSEADNPWRLTENEQRWLERYRRAEGTERETLERVSEAILPFVGKRSSAA